MNRRINLLALALTLLCLPLLAQKEYPLGKYLSKMSTTDQKDDPEARTEFMNRKYKDPKTGKIPSLIREKELSFYSKELQIDQSSLRVAQNLSNWTNRGPFNVGGRTRALAIDQSDENIILAGGVSGGVWRSTNGGQSWSKTTGSNELQSVTAIAQDGGTDTWYYTTGEYSGNSASGTGAFYIGDGIFKSTDNGVSWTKLASTSTEHPESWNTAFEINHEVVVDPENGTVILANYFGLYTSTDGGTSWNHTYNNSSNGAWADVAMGTGGVAYAFVATVGVLKSTNSGASWTDISSPNFPSLASGDRGELAIAASNEDIVYLLLEDPDHASGHGLWKYDNSTGSWTDLSSNIPQEGGQTGDFDSQGGYDLLIKVKPDDENFVIIGGTNLYRSTDGFSSTNNTSWIGGYTPNNNSYALYNDHHPDQHSFVFYPSDPNKVISGNDGGLQFTNDIRATDNATFPITWTPLNNGYLTTQVYAVAIGPDNQILAGLQDNGTWETLTTSPTASWVSPFGGDGAYSAYSSDATKRFMSSQNANIYRVAYTDGIDSSPNGYTEFTPSGYETDLFITPFYLDTESDEIFYLGGNADLWLNTQASTGNTSTGWKNIDIPEITGDRHVISEFGVVGNGTTYLGTTEGLVFKVESANTSSPIVTNISPTETSGRYVSGIGVNEVNSNEVLLVVSNYGVKSIFHSTDGGTNWTDVSGNLEENSDGTGSGPSIRTARILGDGATYIVGTSVGLFSTTSLNGTGTTWQQEDIENLGAVVVEHVVTRNSDNLVVVGTHGNGVYSATPTATSLVDLELVSIDAPSSGILGTESVEVTVRNNGSESANSYELSYSVNTTVQATEVLSTPIPAGSSFSYTFPASFDFSVVGEYTIQASVELLGDENTSNDSKTITIQSEEEPVTISSFPYLEGFESADHGWALNGIWEVGTPNQTNLSAASQGTGALMTDLDSNYPDNAYESAVSPGFNLADLLEPEVAFDLKYDLEVTYDGVVLAYRTAKSGNFSIVTSGTANWYNDNFAALDEDGWTGSGGYSRAVADLSFLAGQSYVEFAFFLVSDGSVTAEGIAIDQFEVYDATDIGSLELTSNSVPENQAAGFAVGTLSLSSGLSATHSLIAGNGDTNNGSFSIDGNSLVTASEFNFEEVSDLSIRVASETADGTVVNILMISVTDENDAPSDLSLTNLEIDEELGVGNLIGMLDPEDEDENDTYAFELVSGDGDSDNASFSIDGSDLVSAEVFDFESKSGYSIRIRATDSGGESIEKSFAIAIADVNEAPGSISLSNQIISYFQTDGYEVGEFSATDPEEDAVEFVLQSEEDMPADQESDNSSFTISGTILQTNGLSFSGMDDLFTIYVDALDARGAFTSQMFELSVEQVLGLVSLAKAGISAYPNPVHDYLNIKIDNNHQGDVHLDVYNTEGKAVYRHHWEKNEVQSKHRINLSGLNPGVYVIVFDMGSYSTEGKLVIR